MFAVQDLSQLDTVYGKDVARTILNLCEVTCILSCRDNASAKTISEWAGSYFEHRFSYTRSGILSIPDGKETISQAERKVIDPSDLMRLQEKGEEILFIKGACYCTKKIAYYKDKILAPEADRIARANGVI